eukprot:3380229-Amphidinium_carterae.1
MGCSLCPQTQNPRTFWRRIRRHPGTSAEGGVTTLPQGPFLAGLNGANTFDPLIPAIIPGYEQTTKQNLPSRESEGLCYFGLWITPFMQYVKQLSGCGWQASCIEVYSNEGYA